MTSKFEKVLNEGLNLPEEAKGMILEAWNEQLSEAKKQVAAELREEFSQKFEYDKGVLVESIDRFLNDKVRAEMSEFAQDKKSLVEQRVKYQKSMAAHAKALNTFVTECMTKEITELRKDRQKANEGVAKLESFMLQQLAEEIQEFHQDKKALVEQKVKMVKEGKEVLVKTKRRFIKEAASVVEKNIDAVLRKEISQYRKDIVAARENDFGRRMFEAFAAEYMTSYLSEGSEVRKLQAIIESKEQKIKALAEHSRKKDKVLESAKVKLNAANDRIQREKVLTSLLSPLGKGKREIMSELLESVKTESLKVAFNKYLPSVLNETVVNRPSKGVLTESKVEKTGDRSKIVALDDSADADINKMIYLAGITK